MEDNAFVLKLKTDKRLEYLKRYYDLAEKFYDVKDQAVTEDEISALIKGLKVKPNPVVRKDIALKDWKFTLDPQDKGVKEGYFFHDYDESGWENVTAPHTFQNVPEDPVIYGRSNFHIYTDKEHPIANIMRGDASAWYKTRLPLDAPGEDDVVYLNIESINLKSDIWFNESPVAMEHLGLFPYKMDVTEPLKVMYTTNPVIAVKVTSTASNIPHMFYNGFQFAYSGKRFTGEHDPYDWLDLVWAGLADDITLSVLNKNHMENVFIHTDGIGGGAADVTFDITLRNQTRNRFTGGVEIEISKWCPEEGPVVYRVNAEAQSLPMNDSVINVTAKLSGPCLWSPDDPNLYLAHIVLKNKDGDAIDDVYETFGVRTFGFKGSHFYLNGKKTVLHGAHDSSHYRAEASICPSHEIIAKDLLLQKKMGANCSRWPSDVRMHNKRIAQYCDQYGLMLSWAGFFDIWTLHSDVEMLSSRDVRTMIRSLRNHPCIVIWEMGDEAFFYVQEYRRVRYAQKMYDWVYESDSTRPIIPTGDYANDLQRYILEYPDQSLSMEERRKRVLAEYPVFDRELAVWDYHLVPFPGIIEMPHKLAAAYGGYKPAIFTEFGFDSYPNPENIKGVYDRFRWKANPFVNMNKHAQDLRFYGRDIQPEDWKITQALHSLITGCVVNILRQYPEEFAGYYFLAMFDLYTYYWGSVDALGNCKLPYYTTGNHYDEIFMSAFHGDILITSGETLKITASNYGPDVRDGRLQIIMRDIHDNSVYETENSGVSADGDVALTTIAQLKVPELPDGIYSFEYYLRDDKGCLLGRMLELAYLEN